MDEFDLDGIDLDGLDLDAPDYTAPAGPVDSIFDDLPWLPILGPEELFPLITGARIVAAESIDGPLTDGILLYLKTPEGRSDLVADISVFTKYEEPFGSYFAIRVADLPEDALKTDTQEE